MVYVAGWGVEFLEAYLALPGESYSGGTLVETSLAAACERHLQEWRFGLISGRLSATSFRTTFGRTLVTALEFLRT